MSDRSVPINVKKTRTHFSGNIQGARVFLNVSCVSFCFQDANYAYATPKGILTKIRACEHLQKFCDHEQSSTHLILPSAIRAEAKFCEHFQIAVIAVISGLTCKRGKRVNSALY